MHFSEIVIFRRGEGSCDEIYGGLHLSAESTEEGRLRALLATGIHNPCKSRLEVSKVQHSVEDTRAKVKLNKPIAVGFVILEISKFITYSFYYDHLKDKYRDHCSLLFTDTDSLCCKIQTTDLYADMGDDLDLYDTSNFFLCLVFTHSVNE